MIVRILVFLLLLTGFSESRSLEPNKPFFQYVTAQWHIQDGLPQSTINDIAQDHLGFIWLATDNGLVKFDGLHFQVFNTSNTPELTTNLISALYFDSKNRLWIGSFLGIFIYEKGEFESVMLGSELVREVSRFVELPSGDTLIATKEKLLIYHNNVLRGFHQQDFPAYELYSHANQIMIGSLGAVVIVKDGVLKKIPLPDATEDVRVTDITYYEGEYWLASDAGFFKLTKDEEIVRSELLVEPVYAVTIDSHNSMWIAAKSGLYRKSEQTGIELVNEAIIINRLLEDRESNLWLCTSNNGLWRISDGMVNRFSTESGLEDTIAWSIEEAASHLLVGTSTALYRFANEKFTSIVSVDELSSSAIYAIESIDSSRVLVGTKRGLFLVTLESEVSVASLDAFNDLRINDIEKVNSDSYRVLTARGVFNLNISRGMTVTKDNQLIDDVRSVIEVDGMTLIGTKQGLKIRGDKADSMKIPTRLKGEFITSVYRSDADRLWVTTYSQGVYFQQQGTWYHLNQDNGLFTENHFNAVEFDGAIWLSGFMGLYRIRITDIEKFIKNSRHRLSPEPIVSESNQLIGAQHGSCCNGMGKSWLLTKEGLWFASNNGIFNVNPQTIFQNNVPPITTINSISTARTVIDVFNYHRDAFKFYDRDLRFDFSVTSFNNPTANRVEVMLEGHDRNWKNLGNVLSAFYPSLSPGRYRLKVRGYNNSGVASPELAEISFVIQGTFLESIAFKLILLFTSLILFYFIYGLLRQRSLEGMLDLERQLTAVEIRAEKTAKELSDLKHYDESHRFVDRLTGAYAYRYLEHQLTLDIHYYERAVFSPVNHPISLVFVLIDIDNFGAVNQQYGRQVGDLILQQFSNLIKRAIRDSDYLVRWHSDKFIVIFRPVMDENVSIVTERIRHLVEQCKFIIDDDEHLRITSSISYSDYPIFPEVASRISWQALLMLAEKGMQKAKEAGGNRWVGYQIDEMTIEKFKETTHKISLNELNEDQLKLLKSW